MAESSKRGRKSKKPEKDPVVSNVPEDYYFGQLLHHGQFSKIGVVKRITTGVLFALKTINSDQVGDNYFGLFLKDIMILNDMSHSNIIKPLTNWTRGPQMALMLPLMTHRSCADICKEKFPNGITENAMGTILCNILPAIEYMHGKGIIHRTVKGSHILISEHGVPILSGFKFAVNVGKSDEAIHSKGIENMTKCLNWLSPEVLGQDKTGFKRNTDIYSLGITILELCNGVVPFSEMTPAAMLVQKLKFGATKLWDKTQLPSTEGIPSTSMEGILDSEDEEETDFEVRMAATDRDAVYAMKSYSKTFHQFIELCLVADNQIRPDASFLMNHKFPKTYSKMNTCNLITCLKLNEPLQFQLNPDGDQQRDLEFQESSANENVSWVFE